MLYLSVCSGVEAASLAWEPLGWYPWAFSEIDPAPCAVLAHRWPQVPNLGDMARYQEWPDAAIDVLVGGTPCQSFSVAGLRKGLADPRGNLMLTFGAIAGRYRPAWLVWENVPGVLSSGGGRDFGAFLGMLAELGYGFAYRVLDAQHFGVPQRRRRVFVVGHLGDWRRAAAVLFERHSLCGNPSPRREAREGITCRAEGIAGTVSSKWAKGSGGPAGDEHYNLIAHTLRGDGFDASEDGTGRGTPLVFDTTHITSVHNRSNPQPGDPCHSLQASADAPALAFDCKASGRNGFSVGQVSATLRAMGHTKSHTNGGGHAAVQVAGAVRRLTPLECERLQGMPDDHTLVPHRGKPMADGPRYKMIGNSMAVPVIRWIGERIAAVDAVVAMEGAA